MMRMIRETMEIMTNIMMRMLILLMRRLITRIMKQMMILRRIQIKKDDDAEFKD